MSSFVPSGYGGYSALALQTARVGLAIALMARKDEAAGLS